MNILAKEFFGKIGSAADGYATDGPPRQSVHFAAGIALYWTSLLVPDIAAAVYRRYRHVPGTGDGRLAQPCVCIQLRRHPDIGALDQALRRLAPCLTRPKDS